MFFDAVKDRVRSVSRAEHDVTPPHSLTRENSLERMERSLSRRGRDVREPRERTALERVSEVLGWEAEENDVGEGWKEFRKGAPYPFGTYFLHTLKLSGKACTPTPSRSPSPPTPRPLCKSNTVPSHGS